MTFQVVGNLLEMHEVAETTSSASAYFVLPTTGLPEISHSGQLGIHRLASEPALIKLIDSSLSVLFALEFDVDIADEMVAQVIADVHFFDGPIPFLQFHEDIFKEFVEMLLIFFFCDEFSVALAGVSWILIEILQ